MLVPTPAEDPVQWDIVEEHLDEAEYLVEDRERTLESGSYDLDEVERGPDERLLAHLDGLLIGGPAVAERLLWPCLEDDDAEAPRRTAAACALLMSGRREDFTRLLDGLAGRELDEHRAIRDALALAHAPWVDGWLEARLAGARAPAEVATLLSVFAARVRDPGPGIRAWVRSEDPDIMTGLAACAARMDRTWGLPLAERALEGGAEPLRRVALLPALTHGSPLAWQSCRDEALRGGGSTAAHLCLALVGAEAERDALHGVLARAGSAAERESVVWALGFSGRRRDAMLCLSLLSDADERIAKLAAEAYCGITGCDAFAVDVPAPVGEPEDDDDDEDDLEADLVPDAVDELPNPDVEPMLQHWAEHGSRFGEGTRWLYGAPAHGDMLLTALRRAPMRRRHAHALELMLRSRGQAAVPTRSWAKLQRLHLDRMPPACQRLNLAVPYARISMAAS